MIYYVTPVVDKIVNNKFFQNRIIYECKNKIVIDPITFHYEYEEDQITYNLQGDDFVEVPENTVLDPRTPLEKYYEEHKQRDSDYHKVYKERMGITVRTWEEEDYLRHTDVRNNGKNPGQPETETLRNEESG